MLPAFFDQHGVNRQALGIGLVSHDLGAQHPLRGRCGRLRGFNQLHAARLAPPTGMHLRLDDPTTAAKSLCGSLRFFWRRGWTTFRNRNAEFGKQLFGLVFMQIHEAGPSLGR